MSKLWDVIAHLGIELHQNRIDYMVRKILKINSPKELASPSFKRGLNINSESIIQLISAWEQQPSISAKEIAAALKSASITSHKSIKRQGLIELVWTGPPTDMVPVRQTEQVLNEVIDLAKIRIFIVSFVAYEVSSIVNSLKRAVERNVRIDVLLEVSDEQGGRVSYDSINLMKEMIPHVNIYIWDQYEKKSSEQYLGAVHPKCAVSDGKLAFITSANLTKAAMEKNMELGVLIKDGKVPEKLDLHLKALITIGIIKKVKVN
ncbi:DISARM system phospholipase D-like protein DrmC [Geomicrobium sp. JCM 19039]|uniref:DISARM system phospholipase D-like protein DrmC n=1 Tax=Geomicrobium sp. JCM 19039 TaxID=1460636 RepID=UPI00045F1A9A|nr:DISARM system phospholipase D-like protein DrmC [Geomicrobium sp. JCM 19039]GAK12352.1 putative phospholipase protein [Geomicrobium sp. JCM 19039]